MQEVYNFTVDPEDVPGDFVAYTVDNLFGDVWCRPGLVGVRTAPHDHRGAGRRSGRPTSSTSSSRARSTTASSTEDQVREIVIHLTHYVGWPLATGDQRGGRAGHRPATGRVDGSEGKGS